MDDFYADAVDAGLIRSESTPVVGADGLLLGRRVSALIHVRESPGEVDARQADEDVWLGLFRANG